MENFFFLRDLFADVEARSRNWIWLDKFTSYVINKIENQIDYVFQYFVCEAMTLKTVYTFVISLLQDVNSARNFLKVIYFHNKRISLNYICTAIDSIPYFATLLFLKSPIAS